jgi:ABC-type lipoprotein release transport system permease subunit
LYQSTKEQDTHARQDRFSHRIVSRKPAVTRLPKLRKIDSYAQSILWATLTALGITLLTISYHAIRAALADSVKALRYE